jgi:hypothetical protein
MAKSNKPATPAADPTAPEPTVPAPDVQDNTLIEIVKQLLAQQHSSSQATADALLDALKKPVQDSITPEYLADPRNRQQKLKKPAYQNAYPVNPDGLSDATIDKLAELKPGSYFGGYLTVAEENGKTFLLYKSRSLADRLEQSQYFTSFSDMVDKIHAEMLARNEKN